jgi:hypothetical protein
MKHTLEHPLKESIIKDISVALDGHKEIILAFVFGSFIQSDTFADIDIGVLTREELNSTLDFELDLETEIEDILHYPVDIRVLNGAPLSFTQNVIRSGRVVLDRDPNLRAEFAGNILKRYFDFSPFRHRYLKEVRNAPI